MNHQQIADVASDAAKLTPPVTATTATLAGADLSTVLVVLTIVYTAAMLVHRIIHWRTPPGGGGK